MNDFEKQRQEFLERQLVRRGPIDSQLILILSRIVAPLIISGLMALTSWIGSHISAAVDAHSSQLGQLATTTQRISDHLAEREKYQDSQFDSLNKVIADHESRLRVLEDLVRQRSVLGGRAR